MRQLRGKEVKLREGELLHREQRNRDYLMKLQNHHLLRNYLLEAGRYSSRGTDTDFMKGWEDSTCQLRGHFLGHWLSAAALHYEETGDSELKAKAGAIIEELVLCQKDNGGEWVCPIPEKYLHWIAKGKMVWAPQYTIHKLFMGLLDVYRYMAVDAALEVADKLADWFYRWSGEFTQEQFDDILDVETGGMLEIWVQLYEIYRDDKDRADKYRALMERYYRRRLFEPLLEGKDVLTNMHANTTIPEVLGCARAYEATGEKKWLDIVQAYWKCAVTDRGAFATGGQTQGEIWTPKMKLKRRLGDKNQEHCTVYNMIRLAEFLFRQTKDPAYMHYIEYNIQNGLLAQAYCGDGLLTYFLPMKAGLKKDWAGEMDSFFCCHGTMVQANAAWNRLLFYQDDKDIYVTQYRDSDVDFTVGGKKVHMTLRQDYMNGNLQISSENNAAQVVNDTAAAYANKPDFRKYVLTVNVEPGADFTLCLRVPDWITGEAKVYLEVPDGSAKAGENGTEQSAATMETGKFMRIRGNWQDGMRIVMTLPIGLRFIPLPDDETTGAFRYGADVLAGITEQERILYLETEKPEEELAVDTERQWGDFLTFYRTENQDPGISFRKINEIVREPYQMYFRIKATGARNHPEGLSNREYNKGE